MEPVKQLEMSRSGKPVQPQAGGTKEGGGVTRAERESHLLGVRISVGLSGRLELERRHSRGERGEKSSGLFLLLSRGLPLLP